jgi:ubiquitin carboxyl-terminal hydrolase L5
VGFVGELLKGVVAAKLEQGGDAAYEKWVDEAKKATHDRREKARKQGVAAE